MATNQLVSLASGSSFYVRSYSGFMVNGVEFLTCDRDRERCTKNSGICVHEPDDQIYYGVLEEILDLSYINNNSVNLFKCKWFDTQAERRRIQRYKNITNIFFKDSW